MAATSTTRLFLQTLAMALSCMAQTAADTAIEGVPRTDANSLKAHSQLLEKTRQGRIDVYFEGDSITRRWGATDYPELLANWTENFRGWNAADFGWGADRVENILWRLENGELDGVNPKVIVLLAGTNNVGNKERGAGGEAAVKGVIQGMRAILRRMREKAPEATVVLTAIFPRNDDMSLLEPINRINAKLATLADGRGVRFLNVNDRLADALKPILRELAGPRSAEDHAPPPTGDPSKSGKAKR